MGEIALIGYAASVANAKYHATGKRIRELPVTLIKYSDNWYDVIPLFQDLERRA